MKSEWRVTSNPIPSAEGRKTMWGVFRIRNVDEVDHSGNREYKDGWFDTKEEAETLAKSLNEQEV